MKAITLCFLSSVPLLAQSAVVSLVQFVDPIDITNGDTITSSGPVAVPVGTNGAETSYLISEEDTRTITSTASGATTTITQTTTNTFTLVASASGYKVTNAPGLVSGLNVECHYTAAQAGECLYFESGGSPSGATSTFTVTGTPQVVAISISDKSGGASPTNNATSGGSSGDRNSATGWSAAGMLAGVLSGLVMGIFAIL
ncbi:hypothetical protein V5O48_005849 [Marasmius crinis-equi]|uniref:Uncharacterized protein n=1 Tax=Marasmius crinis-equi TaxID=585013 RepID=A0ABR3FL55_9AGAR